jgi:hypothetical protein
VTEQTWLDPDNRGGRGPVGWSRQGIRMVRPLHQLPFGTTLPLWDGSSPVTGYDLRSRDSNSAHAELRWADGTEAPFAVRNIPPAGAVMEMTIDAPLPRLTQPEWLTPVLHIMR